MASTSDRLVGECLDELMEQLARTDGRLPAASIASLARLVSAASALRYLHDVDADGRCTHCRGEGGLWPHGPQPCSVYRVLDEFLGCEPSPLARL